MLRTLYVFYVYPKRETEIQCGQQRTDWFLALFLSLTRDANVYEFRAIGVSQRAIGCGIAIFSIHGPLFRRAARTRVPLAHERDVMRTNHLVLWRFIARRVCYGLHTFVEQNEQSVYLISLFSWTYRFVHHIPPFLELLRSLSVRRS